jgi:hypothetical protein
MMRKTTMPKNRSREAQEARNQQKCRHFRSILESKQCHAGIVYRSLGRGEQWPCHGDIGDNITVCPHHQPYTAEELATQDAENLKSWGYLNQAQQQIPKEGNVGCIVCPSCDGDFHWSRSSSNGHTHGRCSNCGIGWMQ